MSMRPNSFVIASILALLVCNPALAQDAVTPVLELDPASPWNLDYADDSCALMRVFGTENQRVLFELRQFSPGETARMMVASDQLEVSRRTPAIASIPGEPSELPAPTFLAGENNMRGFYGRVSPLSRGVEGEAIYRLDDASRNARENEVRGFQINNAFAQPVFLRTGSLHAAMEALRTCMDELVTGWGVDLAILGALTKPPTPLDQQAWTRQILNHFPRTALAQRREASLAVTLLINAEGRLQGAQFPMRSPMKTSRQSHVLHWESMRVSNPPSARRASLPSGSGPAMSSIR
jgi:hypothetical protein